MEGGSLGFWVLMFWVFEHPGSAHVLTTALCLEIIPGGVQETTWGARDRTPVSHVQSEGFIHCARSPAPADHFFKQFPVFQIQFAF